MAQDKNNLQSLVNTVASLLSICCGAAGVAGGSIGVT